MGLEELLAKVLERLDAIEAKEQKGEKVDPDEKAELETQRDQLRAKIAEATADDGGDKGGKGGKGAEDEPDELETLRAYKASRELTDLAEKVATTIVVDRKKRTDESERLLAELFTKTVESKLGDAVSDDGILKSAIEKAVGAAMGSTRRGSRFASADADDDVLDVLAKGGTVQDTPELIAGDIRVGGPSAKGAETKQVKAMLESKNLTVMAGAIYRNHKGIASQEDMLFLRALQQKAMAVGTGSAGGYMVPVEWLPDILPLLRAAAVVRSANPRIVPFAKELRQTSISAGSTAYYRAENAPITVSDITFGEAPLLTPRDLTGLVISSNALLEHATTADDTIRNDLVEVLALREDLAFLQGTGGTEPTGMRNFAGNTLNPLTPGANGFQPTLADWRKLKARTRRLRTPGSRWVAFMAPELITRFETLVDSTGRFLADANLLSYDDNTGRGDIDGLPVFTSTQIPINLTMGSSTDVSYVILAQMSDLIVGESRDLRLDISTEAAYQISTVWHSTFQEDQTAFRAILSHDINHRRQSQVIVQEGVRTTP